MLQGKLSDTGTYDTLLSASPAWSRALEWLRTVTPATPLGTHELDGARMFASVQEYQTQARSACRFESHRDHVDIQYTIVGRETIDWIDRGCLAEEGPFENDVQFWKPPESGFSALDQSEGRFSIFFPADAHRPKVAVDAPAHIRKVVVKIHRSLLGS